MFWFFIKKNGFAKKSWKEFGELFRKEKFYI